MPIDEIKKVGFIGAGTMGCFNSLLTAIFGYECVLYDISKAALEQAPTRQKELGQLFAGQSETVTPELVDAALSRISYVPDLKSALKEADLVSETVLEKRDVKRAVHKELDALCDPKTILTTNTSYMLVSEIEDVVKRGDKFAALHFHLGAMLVDIVGGPRTSPETIHVLKRFADSLMLTTIVGTKEKDGYLYNSIVFSIFKTALNLVADGYGSITDVDRAYIAGLGVPYGPFGSMDGVGLDIILATIEDQGRRRDTAECEKAADIIRPMIERGDLGMKTGKGFYTYPNPAYQDPNFLKGQNS